MSQASAYRTPFVLGKPIKNPIDFYGRKPTLRECFEAARAGQRLSIVGEHRCGNTSIIYQMVHPEVRAEYLAPAEDESLRLAFVSSQLAAESPEALLRRIARALKRVDPDSSVDFSAAIDQRWLEDYLEDLADRNRRLVLLIDEIEVLASFEESFWEWFEHLVNEYDIAIVATSRSDLGQFRSETGQGPPFFNTIRSTYIGSFSPATVDHFLREKADLVEFDFLAVKDAITALAGRFPYYLQQAAALIYFHAGGSSTISEEQLRAAGREFATRTAGLFDDAWPKLPESERVALTWLAMGTEPGAEAGIDFDKARHSLERRGYLVEGQIFSRAFTDFIRERLQRIELGAESGKLRVGRRLSTLAPKERALLALFLERPGIVVSREDIGHAVWPEYENEPLGVTDAMIEKLVSRLRAEIEPEGGAGQQHIESIRGLGYRFQNRALDAAS